MKSFAQDISFMEEKDCRFWDTGNNLSKVAAHVVLAKNTTLLSEEEISTLSSLHNNLPVRYNDGIFRVLKVGENPEDNGGMIWEVEIEGYFTAEDPNGIIVNGWKDEELVWTPAAAGAITDLEL